MMSSRRKSAYALGRIERSAFDLHLEGLASFGGNKPRAVVATVAPQPALFDLQAEQERLMRRIGLEPEPRKFTPHVTLARLRNGVQPRCRGLSCRRAAISAPRRSAYREFVLFSSRASTGGGPYVVEARYPSPLTRAERVVGGVGGGSD